MDTALKQIVERMTGELREWLEQPSEAGKKIERLRSELESLKAELGAEGLATSLKNLDGAEKEAKRVKQREAAEAIAALCRPLGVALEAREPPKQVRKPASGKSKKKSEAAEQ